MEMEREIKEESPTKPEESPEPLQFESESMAMEVIGVEKRNHYH